LHFLSIQEAFQYPHMLPFLQELVRAALEHTSQKTFKHAFLKEGAEKGVEASPDFVLTRGRRAADCLGCVHRGGGTLSWSGFRALCMGCRFCVSVWVRVMACTLCMDHCSRNAPWGRLAYGDVIDVDLAEAKRC
jgi:hypothetical protein